MSHLLRVVATACCRFSRPGRKPLKYCTCGTGNEPDRTTCIGCGGRF